GYPSADISRVLSDLTLVVSTSAAHPTPALPAFVRVAPCVFRRSRSTPAGGHYAVFLSRAPFDVAGGRSGRRFQRVDARGLRLPEPLGEPDQDPFRAADIAKTVDAFVVDDLVDDRRAELAEPGERVRDVLDREHDAQVPERVHGRVAVIGGDRRRVEARKLEAAVPVRRAQHRDLDALAVQPRHAAGPLAF